MSRKGLLIVLACIGLIFFVAKPASAASLSSLSDTVSTSRPSAATPLGGNAASGDGNVTIVDNNAVFLQGDSATIYADTGETTNTGNLVASMSATAIPGAGQRIVYFTNTIGNNHHQGDAVVVPITAMHTISFKPVASIPIGGKIVISFPQLASTVDSNPASPSAQAFQFNGLTTGNVQVNFSSGSTTCSGGVAIAGTSAGSTPTLTCTTATATVAGGTTVTLLIGCSAHSGAACTTQVPTLINPMRVPGDTLAGQGAATTKADNWKIGVQTQDASSVTLDQGSAVVGTIESVQVQAQIDPTLTFELIGIANNQAIDATNGYTGCSNTTPDTTNSGISTTATNVNMGTVGTLITITAQKALVATNGTGGYALTATASGQLTDSNVGHSLTSVTTPDAIAAGTEQFGIHPCGTDVANASTSWNASGNGTQESISSGNGWIGWPTPTTSVQLASRTGTANNIITAIEYAITASPTTPAGLYTAVITYVATPTFD